MIRDVLTGRRDNVTKADPSKADRNKTGGGDMHLELAATDHEEPTWEVRQPGRTGRTRMDRRTRSILIGAAIAAVVVNAGAAWVYWQVTGSETAEPAASSVSMALRARSDLDQPMRPGETSDITVTVTNDYDFPIRITSLAPGTGNIVADDEHREAGCRDAPVAITQARFHVSWAVQRNTIGAFTVPEGLVMRRNADPACVGAVYTVPVQVFGVGRDVS